MNILWVVGQVTPDMMSILHKSKSPFGGWVQNMLNELKKSPELKISVVGCDDVASEVTGTVDGIQYYIIPIMDKNKLISDDAAKSVVECVKPDIIHIEGTEWSIANCFSKVKVCPNIVSLQGILSGYERYQFGNLPIAEMMFSCKNIVAGWTLFFRKKMLFDKRIRIENETIQNADNLLGRTIWDRAHSYKINHVAPYYECPRILRSDFYGKVWRYETCKKHSIFVGNGYSALKGAHIVIEAVAQLRNEYSDIHLNIAGNNPSDKKFGFKSKIGYASYVKKLIRKHKLQDCITFTGTLQGDKMSDVMLNSNVFVLPSLIENSPNTLGEAMILGVPIVSAYTGGVPSMITDNTEALFYRADDPAMMAWQIKQVFDNTDAAVERTQLAREHALKTHNPENNKNIMLSIYREIYERGK